MADKNSNVNINIKVNSADSNKKKIKEVGQGISDAGKAQETAAKSSDKLSDSFEKQSRASEKVTTKKKKVKEAAEDTAKAQESESKATDKATTSTEKQSAASEKAAGSKTRLKTKVKEASDSFEAAHPRLTKFNDAMGDLGIIAAAATFTLGVVATKALEAAESFDNSWARIGAISGKTEEQLGKTSNAAMEMADNLRMANANKLSESLAELESTGYNTNEAFEILNETVQGAKGNFTSAKIVTDAVSTTLSTFNMKSSQAGQVVDTFTKTLNVGKGSMDELNSSLGTAIGLAPTVSARFAEVSAVLATLSVRGETNATAATKLQAIFQSAINPTIQSIEAQKDLKETWDISTIRAKGFTKALEDLIIAGKGHEQELAQILGTTEAIVGVQKLASDGLVLYKSNLKEIENATGANAKALEYYNKTFDASQEKFDSAATNIKILFGQELQNISKPLLEIVTEIISFFNKLDPTVKKSIMGVAGWTFVIGSAGAAIATATIAASSLVTAVMALGHAMTAAGISANMLGAGMAKAFAIGAPIAIGVAAIGGFFWAIDKAVQAASESSNGYIKTLGEILDKFNAIKLVQVAWDTYQTNQQNADAEVKRQEELNKALETASELKRKDVLTTEEMIELQKALITLSVNTNNSDAKKRLSKEAQELEKLINESEEVVPVISNRWRELTSEIENELAQATLSSFDNQKREIQKKYNDMLNELIIEGNKSGMTEAQVKESTEYINLKKAEAAEIAKVNKQAKDEADKLNQETAEKRKRQSKELQSLERSLTDDINQNKLTEYEYKKKLLEQDRKDNLAKLVEIGANEKINSALRKKIWEAYYSDLAALDKQRTKDIKQNQEEIAKTQKTAKDFAVGLQREIIKLTGDEKTVKELENKERMEGLDAEWKAIHKNLLAMENIDGIKVFTPARIKELETEAKKAMEALKLTFEAEAKKIDAGKIIKDNISKLREGLADLADEENLLSGVRLAREKEYWAKILAETSTALANKQDLVEQDIKELENTQKEAQRNISKSQKEIDKLIEEAPRKLARGAKQVIDSTGLVSESASKAFSMIISDTENIQKTFKILSGPEGLGGLQNHVANGGSIDGMVGMFSLLVEQTNKFGQAFTDNMRPIHDFNDAVAVSNDVAKDLVNTLTLGIAGKISDGILGLFGVKSPEQINKLKEMQLRNIKDEEQAIEANYQFQKQKIKDTVKDYDEQKAALESIEQDYQSKKLNLEKQRRDSEISLIGDTRQNILAWYNNEKNFIEKSVANWKDRNLKMQLLDKEYFDKQAEYMINLERDRIDLAGFDQAEEAFQELMVTFREIDKDTDDATEKRNKQLKATRDLILEMQKIQEDFLPSIEKLMSKYYDREKQRILANHRVELQTIKDREKKIKENEAQMNRLRLELEKIERQFDKRLDDKALTREASSLFKQDRDAFIGQNGGLDASALVRTESTEFERQMAARQEELDILLEAGEITAEEHAEKMKDLAIEQNVYWSHISKNLVKGTREYDEAIKKANDGFRLYKESVKASIEAQKQTQIENSGISEQMDKLTEQNTDLQQDIQDAQDIINPALESLDEKFKDLTGGWKTDINDVKNVLGSIGLDAAKATSELNKLIEARNKAADTEKKYNKNPGQAPTANTINLDAAQRDYYDQPLTDKERADIQLKAIMDGMTKVSGKMAGAYVAPTPQSGFIDLKNAPLAPGTNFNSWNPFDQFSLIGNTLSGKDPLSGFKFHDKGGVSDPNKINILGEKRQEAAVTYGDFKNIYRAVIENVKPSASAPAAGGSPTIIINGTQLSEGQLKTAVVGALHQIEQEKRWGVNRR